MGLPPEVREDNRISVAWKADIILWDFSISLSTALFSALPLYGHVPCEMMCLICDL